jgi:hypothetical protein
VPGRVREDVPRLVIPRVELVWKIPMRPLPSNAYVVAPWCSSNDAKASPYIPSAMSGEALINGLAKAHDWLPVLNEESVCWTENYITNQLKTIWVQTPEELVMDYDEAVGLLNMKKSPGFPHYYTYQSKGDLMEKQPARVKALVHSVLEEGAKYPFIFAGTLKTELRLKEKVQQNKTRFFMASDVIHLLCSKQMYGLQNEVLMDNFGKHPITLGIQMPGPQFVHFVKSLGPELFDADIDGCDLRFNLRVARAICSIRHNFLPTRYRQVGHWLYSTVYCGLVAVNGGIYRLNGNKSGWENTTADNSFMTWFMFIYVCHELWPDVTDFSKLLKLGINGDDVIAGCAERIFTPIIAKSRSLNFLLEVSSPHAKNMYEAVFLSHHLQERFVYGMGDFVLCAGNLPKLLSSINWVKKSSSLTFEEGNVAHLLGVRICLFPWAAEFDRIDKILGDYLKTIQITPFVTQALKARLSEYEMSLLHTRREFLFSSIPGLRETVEFITSLVLKHLR